MSSYQIALGVDVGGTKVAAGLVDSGGKILFKTRALMNAHGSAYDAMECVHHVIRTSLMTDIGQHVSAIGVAAPGPLELPAGVVLETPNLPCWRNFPLGESVRHPYGLPTRVDNDANAAGLAEALWGAGKDHYSVFYATLGTGIGTAIIFDKQIFYGRTGTAPEGGHMTLDFRGQRECACGKPGCLESMASGPSIVRRARQRSGDWSIDSVLRRLCAGDPQQLTTEMVAQAWHEGDSVARDIMQDTADMLSVWFGNIIDLIEPDVIVVGGGMGKLASEWFDYITAHIRSCSINSRCNEIPLTLAQYGSDAGIAGAAALCFTEPANIRVPAAPRSGIQMVGSP